MTQTLADVLGIAPGNNKPNAYELLGLAAGESNPQRIEAAIEGTVERLKRSQSETDAAVWKQAAAAVTKARKLLIDPQLKAAYDAKLQKRAQASNASKRVRGEAAQDPLRGLLPAMDPLAPFDVDAAAQRASQARAYEPPPLPPGSSLGQFDQSESAAEPPPAAGLPPIAATPPAAATPPVATPEISLVLDDEPAAAGPAIGPVVAPAVARPTKRRRRRGSPLLMLGFGLLMLAMLSGAGYGVYTLVQREQQRNNPVAQANPNTPRAAAPAARPASRPVDPVMGNVGARGAGSAPDPSSLPPLTANVDVPLPPPLDTSMTGNNSMDGNDAMGGNNSMTPPPATVTDPAASMQPGPEPEPAAPSPAELQAGQTAIAAAEAAIKSQGWTEMKSLAEKAQAAAANPQQKEIADQLFEVADLADYYYHGVVKAMEELPSGNTFMLTAGAEVAVVESSGEQIVLQVRGRPKTFPFNDMPFILVHKLGSFTMTGNDPTVIAAKAVFQSLAKKALPQDREQAAEWLIELPAEVNGSHPHQIADTLARLFPGSP
ncbi:hypothetical protein [Roseimaritima ulvae]|uniref:Uncharacterized protein n=1 Tax=Roseimaritima ulvae TaxID=980254 RepID=A0A5B9QZ65_9BACT|nr:hypothetical protein [Roseimaritima ulvae]QEG42705.1 hypothetical protein UC8_47470 [Roseimaritima ulvae]